MPATSYTAREAFDMLRDYMADPDYRVYYADALDRHDDQDFAVLFSVADGAICSVVPLDYCQPEYDAFWRLVRWNNHRLDLGKY